MDWLQFIAAIVGHLAWPLVIVALFVILRKHMGALADRLLEFSFGGAKITFHKILQRGAEIIDETPVPHLPKPDEEPELPLEPSTDVAPSKKTRAEITTQYVNRRRRRKERLSKTAFGTVIFGLEQVDNLLFEIGDAMGIDAAQASSVMYTLVARKRVPESIGKLYDTLRDARNLLAHSPTLPDEREAAEYVRQTSFLKTVLILVKQSMKSKSDRSGNE